MIVYIVTSTELGWDCVAGVYDSFEEAQKHAGIYGRHGHVSEKIVESKFIN